MRIVILGAGKMGSFFAEALCDKHEVAVFDTNSDRLKFLFNTLRFTDLSQIAEFDPEICINAVTIQNTIPAFKSVMPFLSPQCVLSDIVSVKTGLKEFYAESGYRYVSTHPMFGPTFANLTDLSTQNAIIISEGDCMAKAFFKEFYRDLQLNLFEYSFEEHDQTIAYSLSIPFISSLVFGSVMKHQESPGTTFKKQMQVARGLLSEDDFLLSEILFNPYTMPQFEAISVQMSKLAQIIQTRDSVQMKQFLDEVRGNLI